MYGSSDMFDILRLKFLTAFLLSGGRSICLDIAKDMVTLPRPLCAPLLANGPVRLAVVYTRRLIPPARAFKCIETKRLATTW